MVAIIMTQNFNIKTVSDLIKELHKYLDSYGDLPIKMDALEFDDAKTIDCVNPAGGTYQNPECICINTYE